MLPHPKTKFENKVIGVQWANQIAATYIKQNLETLNVAMGHGHGSKGKTSFKVARLTAT